MSRASTRFHRSSQYFEWNSVNIGPQRDLIGDLWAAMRSRAPHMRLGLYHLLLEWVQPRFMERNDQYETLGSFRILRLCVCIY